jgi:hypothetical protein
MIRKLKKSIAYPFLTFEIKIGVLYQFAKPSRKELAVVMFQLVEFFKCLLMFLKHATVTKSFVKLDEKDC